MLAAAHANATRGLTSYATWVELATHQDAYALFARSRRLVAAAANALSEPVYHWQSMVVKTQSGAEQGPWHQDRSWHPHALRPHLVTALVVLDFSKDHEPSTGRCPPSSDC